MCQAFGRLDHLRNLKPLISKRVALRKCRVLEEVAEGGRHFLQEQHIDLRAAQSETAVLGVRIRGTLGDIDPLSKVFKRARSRVKKGPP